MTRIKDAPISNEMNANSATKEDLENGNGTKEKAKFGTANFLIELENRRAIKVSEIYTFVSSTAYFTCSFVLKSY